LTEKNTTLIKTIENRKNTTKNTEQTPIKETREIGTQTETKPKQHLFTCDICEQNKKSQLHLSRVNGLGINPTKQNKICATCFKKVDLIPEPQEEFF
jgi:hypothetical protein